MVLICYYTRYYLQALKGDSAKKPEPEKPKSPEKKAPPKKEPAAKPASKKPVKKKAAKKEPETSESGIPQEAEINEDVAIDKCIEIFGEETVKMVQQTAWKERLQGLKNIIEGINQKFLGSEQQIPTQAIFRLLSLKPGFKDTNFQCNQEKFKIIGIAGANPKLSETSLNIVFDYCLDKIADVKCGKESLIKNLILVLIAIILYDIIYII